MIFARFRASRRAFLGAAAGLVAVPWLPGAARAGTDGTLLLIDTVDAPAPAASAAIRLTLSGERLARVAAMQAAIRRLRPGDAIEAHLDDADLLFLDVAIANVGRAARAPEGRHPTRLVIT